VLWYISFMFLVAVILLNVLLAIIVDSYMSAKEEELETWQVCGCRVQGVHTAYENTGVGCLRFIIYIYMDAQRHRYGGVHIYI